MPPTVEFGPPNFTVPVFPLKVPLLIQLPPILCEYAPPLKVVELPMETFPLMVILDAALNNTEVP